MFAVSFCMGISRPLCNHMVLEQVHSDIGAASSLIAFLFFYTGRYWYADGLLLPDAKIILIATMALVGSLILAGFAPQRITAPHINRENLMPTHTPPITTLVVA